MKDLTPMMAQYMAIKARYPDALVFFRLGDFYEMFMEDAEIGARELGITLTGRDVGKDRRVPMCGVPHHAVEDYIKVLVDKGYKVAICDQMEDPQLSAGLVKREVVRVVTPGTFWEGTDSSWQHCLVAIAPQVDGTEHAGAGLASCDLSTGEILVAWFSGNKTVAPGQKAKNQLALMLSRELPSFFPRECLVPLSWHSEIKTILQKTMPEVFVTPLPDENFQDTGTDAPVEELVFHPETFSRIAKESSPGVLPALRALLGYIRETQMMDLAHLKEPAVYRKDAYLEMNRSTKRNLELVQRLQGGFHGSLAWVLDKCYTSMGSRLLKQWVERPLRDATVIQARLDAVEELFNDAGMRGKVRKLLQSVKDLERLAARLSYRTCTARDLIALASSLEAAGELSVALGDASVPRLVAFRNDLDSIPELAELIRKAIVDDPPASATEGGIVRDGYDSEVDSLREIVSGSRRWVIEFEERERERTGIKSLKVGYNRVFGYYIEVTKSNLSLVPEDYVRKQTLATCERFTTRELKEREASILGAEEKLYREEYRIFCEIRDKAASYIRRIQKTAAALAELDVLASFAETASLYGYVKPRLSDDGRIEIREGRHPVLERVLPPGSFVPNDIVLDSKQRILVITGPNMGGKSTFCRQTALIVLMAQMGSFVPAKSCSISCMDKIFARVGAYDDLVLGQSTFMVEMAEVAEILREAEGRSLIILDEIGRGTSTFDGLSVAWAVVEHLAGESKSSCRVLVATHYRELTLLADLRPGVSNYCVSVKRTGDQIVFLRKVSKGVAEGSFGIDVAAMAGLPPEVVARARDILASLESEARARSRYRPGILGHIAWRTGESRATETVPGQMSLFLAPDMSGNTCAREIGELIQELQKIEPDRMTPLQALEMLYALKRKVVSLSEGAQ